MARKKDDKRFTKIFVVFISVIFLLSSIAYVVLYRAENADTNTDNFKQDFNNITFDFQRKSDPSGQLFYEVTSSNGKFVAYYLPSQLFKTGISEEALAILRDKPYFYLTFDPDDFEVSAADFFRFEIRNNLPSGRFFQEGQINESQAYTFPIVTCINATSDLPVVYMHSANTTNITAAGNCIDFQFARFDFLRLRDIFVYSMQGIEVGDNNA